MPKHKHYDVILAWASGEQIHFFDSHYKQWIDYVDSEEQRTPDFCTKHTLWRIKPKTYTKKYRMALLDNPEGSEVFAICLDEYSLDSPAEREVKGFVRWIGEAVEVEFEGTC